MSDPVQGRRRKDRVGGIVNVVLGAAILAMVVAFGATDVTAFGVPAPVGGLIVVGIGGFLLWRSRRHEGS